MTEKARHTLFLNFVTDSQGHATPCLQKDYI